MNKLIFMYILSFIGYTFFYRITVNIFEKKKRDHNTLNYSVLLEAYRSRYISFVYYILCFSLEKHVFESDFFRKFNYYFVYLHEVEAAFLLFCLLSDCKLSTKISKKLELILRNLVLWFRRINIEIK